ncbi:dipeptidase [Pullulanibacillus sp. KACC 23026]|uniref:dipeptidase n=1 Tax=Pullulanibacillus sp. KACC 23026 TaxID=3028315 RepID=UPI0023B07C5E|nr:dipeptidase [Pullulanibacillus sp. KACC 23026]WEG11547.1 dipeptidase [Pullulanibacillus sp. KACC 23026]
MMLPIFDAHCDVLFRLENDPSLSFQSSEDLHINMSRLEEAGAKVQLFALFVSDTVPQELKFTKVLNMVDLFYNEVLDKQPNLKPVRTKKDIDHLQPNEVGAMLTLEGCDAIGRDLVKLRTLFQLGVKNVGLTWNASNAVADGAKESRGAGLTDFGREVVRENNRFKVWTDVSHLSEAGFWDVMQDAEFPIASHSNCKVFCDHPRNLSDKQITALIKRDGMIGVTFVPDFLTPTGKATIDDVLRHVEHIASLGGMKNLGFGSDFDGIETTPENLSNFGQYPNLINELLKRYSEEDVHGMLYQHFVNHLPE